MSYLPDWQRIYRKMNKRQGKKVWRNYYLKHSEEIKAYQKKYRDSRKEVNMKTFRNNQRYTAEEVADIVSKKNNGMKLSKVAKEHGRTVAAINTLLYLFKRYQSGTIETGRWPHYVEAFKGAEQLLSGSPRTFQVGVVNQEAVMENLKAEPPVEVPASIKKLEAEFERLQNIIVEVVDAEVERRTRNIIQEYAQTKTELNQYKEAAQESSMVGMLRKKWGLGV